MSGNVSGVVNPVEKYKQVSSSFKALQEAVLKRPEKLEDLKESYDQANTALNNYIEALKIDQKFKDQFRLISINEQECIACNNNLQNQYYGPDPDFYKLGTEVKIQFEVAYKLREVLNKSFIETTQAYNNPKGLDKEKKMSLLSKIAAYISDPRPYGYAVFAGVTAFAALTVLTSGTPVIAIGLVVGVYASGAIVLGLNQYFKGRIDKIMNKSYINTVRDEIGNQIENSDKYFKLNNNEERPKATSENTKVQETKLDLGELWKNKKLAFATGAVVALGNAIASPFKAFFKGGSELLEDVARSDLIRVFPDLSPIILGITAIAFPAVGLVYAARSMLAIPSAFNSGFKQGVNFVTESAHYKPAVADKSDNSVQNKLPSQATLIVKPSLIERTSSLVENYKQTITTTESVADTNVKNSNPKDAVPNDAMVKPGAEIVYGGEQNPKSDDEQPKGRSSFRR